MLQFVGVAIGTMEFFGSGLVEKSLSRFNFLNRATSSKQYYSSGRALFLTRLAEAKNKLLVKAVG